MKIVILTINIIATSSVPFSATGVEMRPGVGCCLEDKASPACGEGLLSSLYNVNTNKDLLFNCLTEIF